MYFIEIDASFRDGRDFVQYDGLVGPFGSAADVLRLADGRYAARIEAGYITIGERLME
ncbi:MAG TPA: hypothetical protein VFT66_15570 [Roseiflexaceae bacterium]|nr:hypothetical protein [Roseiflexaceae bacterium]